MQAILSFFTTAGTTAAAAAPAAADAATTAATAAGTVASTASTAVGWGSKILQGLRIGTSAVSALSVFGKGEMEASQLRAEAANSTLQSRQEFIQGQQSANDLEKAYNQTVLDQLAVASASGIDVASGGVTDARNQARDAADRQLSITRGGIEMNAALRRARASYLTGAAGLTREVGTIGAVSRAAAAGGDASRIG